MRRETLLKQFKPIERLRRLRGDEPARPAPISDAITRIANSNDGQILLEWLWTESYGRRAPKSDNEMRERDGQMKLFDRLIAHIEESKYGPGRSDHLAAPAGVAPGISAAASESAAAQPAGKSARKPAGSRAVRRRTS